VIRGGWGIFWAPNFALGAPFNSEGVTATSAPSVSNDGNKTPAVSLSNPFPNGLDKPVGSALGGLTGVGKPMTIFSPTATSPRVQQFSFDVQRQLSSGLLASIGYSGSRTANLTWTTAALNFNQLDPRFFSQGAALTQAVPNPFVGRPGAGGIIGGSTVARNQLLRPHPQFASVNFNAHDRNRAQYDAIAIRVQKNMSKGLTFLTTYTLSKNFDMAGGGPGNNLNAGNAGPQDVYSFDGEWGLSYLHSPHRFTSAITYELPFGRGKSFLGSSNYISDLVIGGWKVSSIVSWRSGLPINVGLNANGINPANNQAYRFLQRNGGGLRPDRVGTANTGISPKDNRFNFLAMGAYRVQALNTPGNAARNSAYGPRQFNTDFAIRKEFKITERQAAEFRWESFNFFNTVNFNNPATTFGNTNFGVITSAGDARVMQLAVRYQF